MVAESMDKRKHQTIESIETSNDDKKRKAISYPPKVDVKRIRIRCNNTLTDT